MIKIVSIPPYRAQNYDPVKGQFMVREIVDGLKEKGLLEGVEVDIDPGHPIENTTDTSGRREEHVMAYRAFDSISAGTMKRVMEFGGGDRYDAIITSGGIDPGFIAARMASRIPVAAALHSAAHFASAICDRFSVIHLDDPTAIFVRRAVESYGLGHKLASVRSMGHSSPSTMAVLKKTKPGERYQTPEGKEFIDHLLAQCIVAIEEDRAEALIFGTPAVQCLQGEVLQRLDEKGYGEIQIVCGLRSAIEMARSMVNMKIRQADRAYPHDSLKAKPRFR